MNTGIKKDEVKKFVLFCGCCEDQIFLKGTAVNSETQEQLLDVKCILNIFIKLKNAGTRTVTWLTDNDNLKRDKSYMRNEGVV